MSRKAALLLDREAIASAKGIPSLTHSSRSLSPKKNQSRRRAEALLLLWALRAAELTFGRAAGSGSRDGGRAASRQSGQSSAHDGAAFAPGPRGAEAGKWSKRSRSATPWCGASKANSRSAEPFCGGAGCAGEGGWWRTLRRRSTTNSAGRRHPSKGAGGSAGPRPVGPAGFGWLRGGWRDGCALQHTMRGSVKRRGAGRPPLESRRGARRHGGLVRRRFALPLLYAERSAALGAAPASARVSWGDEREQEP